MGVQIDQSGDEYVIFQRDPLLSLEATARLTGGEDSQDATIVDSDGMVTEYNIRLDGNDPAGFDQEVDIFRC